MLLKLLTDHREELIKRCRAKAEQRPSGAVQGDDVLHGSQSFFESLQAALRAELTPGPARHTKPADHGNEPAAQHGAARLKQGFAIEDVVYDSSDMCQTIVDLAEELGESLQACDFKLLSRCVGNAAAASVMEYAAQRDLMSSQRQLRVWNERLGEFAHELRNQLYAATLALSALKGGDATLDAASRSVLDRSLLAMRTQIDRSLEKVRNGPPVRPQLFRLTAFLSEIKVVTTLEAKERGCTLTITEAPRDVALSGDRDLLFAAMTNLLQNAFKFTRAGTEVKLHAQVAGDRVLLAVSDHCGGLPPGAAETIFLPFVQGNEDRSGLGLGLPICQRSVKANGGVLSVRDVPGTGCVFTVDLPYFSMSGHPLPAVE